MHVLNTVFGAWRDRAIALGLALFAAGCGGAEGPLDVQRYELSGAFDWEAQRLDATVRITLAGAGDQVELDCGVESVEAVRGPDGEALAFELDAEARRLRIDLPGGGDPVTIAVDYTAAPGEHLRAIPLREGDPLPVRVLFTDSEPRGARDWMPCNDRPDDRAELAVTMRMAGDESMISNGALTTDEAGSGERTMGYNMSTPIPTYLMAFAISRFEVETSSAGPVPVSVWHRAGAQGSYQAVLDELNREVGLFEGLLGPYPFEQYRLVLLPEMPGGMENAGITFQNEARSAEPEMLADATVTAHELAHQWFGDLVTVATWDDVWIKEGLATLLEAEAMRPFEDRGGAGTLFGDWLYPEDGVPVRDPLLAPEDKYGSGPYSRAAWVFTQIRAVVGEQAFWGTLRDLLAAHRFGAVGTADVIDAFAPALGPDAAEAARRAVDLGSLPHVGYEGLGDELGRLFITDPDGVLVAPFEVEWRRADGTRERLSPAADGSILLERRDPGDLLIIDPRDIHPIVWTFPLELEPSDAISSLWLPDLVGIEPATVARYDGIGGTNQLAALDALWWGDLPFSVEEFPGFVASLDAESARALALDNACSLGEHSEQPEAWGAMVAAVLAEGPPTLGLDWTRRQCAELPEVQALFAPEWEAWAAGGTSPTGISLGRLEYAAEMTAPPGTEYDMWSSVVKGAPSLRARAVAARRIRAIARSTATDPDTGPPWRALVLDLLETSETSEVLREILGAVAWYSPWYTGGGDSSDLLAALVKVLRSPATMSAHWRAVCAARSLTREDPAAWQSFVAALDGAPLSHLAAHRLAHPLECD